MRWLALLALVACHGSSPRIDAAPGPDLAAEVARVEHLEQRACACRDVACLDEVDAALATYLDVATAKDPVRGPGLWPDDLVERVRASEERMNACFAALAVAPDVAKDHAAVRNLERYAEHACACADDACRRETVEALARVPDMGADIATDPPLASRMRDAVVALGRCLAPVIHDRVDAAAVALGALRDRACACPDAACEQVISAELNAWITAEPVTNMIVIPNERIAKILQDLTACWKRVAG